METVVEFGARGGRYFDNFQCKSIKQGVELAEKLVHVVADQRTTYLDLSVGKYRPRATWQSATHFVAVSILDGKQRGPATQSLWSKETP